MEARDLPVVDAVQAARLVRALGSHRYVAGRLHMVHAFVFDAAGDDAPELATAAAWARTTLADPSIDRGSKDERLWRASTEAEIAHALIVFWSAGARAEAARIRLAEALTAAGIAPQEELRAWATPEDDIFPILIDAGWELHPLSKLDPERHKGAIAAFGEPIFFDTARFEEENAEDPPAYLQELPAIGPAELLAAVDELGQLEEPLTLWTEGSAAYHDYVIRGVLRAAKLDPG